MRGEAKQSEYVPRLKRVTLPETLLVLSSAVVSVSTLIWVLWSCRYGMDFTDEGFYLLWISNPFIYPISHTQFGFVYHPLYELLDGNIAALRQANILIFFCLAWVLTTTFFKTILTPSSPLPTLHGWQGTVMAAGVAVLSLTYLNHYFWLPTPNYNSLVLQSLMIAATGLLLVERASRESLAGCLLLGIGGWLAFMAKPTTAIALGGCSVFYLLAVGRLTARSFFMPMAVAVISFVVGALTIDGSVTGFIKRVEEGIESMWLLESRHGLADVLRYDPLSLGERAGRVDGRRGRLFLRRVTASFKDSGVCVQRHNAGRGVSLFLLGDHSWISPRQSCPGSGVGGEAGVVALGHTVDRRLNRIERPKIQRCV